MRTSKQFTTFLLAVVIVFASSCAKNNDDNGGGNTSLGNVTVTTLTPTDITSTGATCGAEVTAEAGAMLMEMGVCWSTTAYPTINDSYLSTKNCSTTFVCTLEDLTPETKYHVRAYALNGTSYVYGEDKGFTTLADEGGDDDTPIGAIKGLFSVSANKQVYFSQGNLQYQASTNTWRFAENQWDYVGGIDGGKRYGDVYESGIQCDNSLASENYSGWIDLFGFGTSGWDCGNTYYHPWDIETGSAVVPTGYLYGPYGSLLGEWANSDWGVYNPIGNGGNQAGLWRTLSSVEWEYLLFSRNTSSGWRFAKVTVNDVEGVAVLPDDWIVNEYNLNNVNDIAASFSSNVMDAVMWRSYFEAFGVVFLPTAGVRLGSNFMCGALANNVGVYWTSSAQSMAMDNGYSFYFNSNSDFACYEFNRAFGSSVRLVQDHQ